MNKKLEFIESKLLPISFKVANNITLMSIRDGLASILPLIIIGAFFLIIGNIPIPGYDVFLNKILGKNSAKILAFPVSVTYDLLSLYAAFAIAYYRCGYANIKSKINCGIVSLASFMILIPFEKLDGSNLIEGVVPTQYLGAQCLFSAIVVALVSANLYIFIVNKKWVIKMPKEVPSAVSESFVSLVPILVSLILFLVVKIIFMYTSFGNFSDFVTKVLQIPLSHLTGSLWGAIIINFLVSLLWIFGLHGGAIVGSIVLAPLTALAVQNKDAFIAGAHHMPNIVTQQFLDNFTYIGGGGSTLSLLLCLIIFAKKYKGLKKEATIAKMSFVPALFNINEPVIFGLPIVYNFVLAIPFILGPVVMTLITYFAMSLGLVSAPVGVAVPWTAPPFISGFLATFDWRAIILQLVLIVVPMFIYWPFVKLLSNINLKTAEKCEVREEK